MSEEDLRLLRELAYDFINYYEDDMDGQCPWCLWFCAHTIQYTSAFW